MEFLSQLASVDQAVASTTVNLNLPAGVGIIGVIGLILVIYLIYGSTLSIIADKAGVKRAWRAWIPVLNILLECEIAGIPYTYVVIWFVASIIVGLLRLNGVQFIDVLLSMFIWAGICKRLGKNPWLGIIGGIPLINIFLQIYLAASKSSAPKINVESTPMITQKISSLPVDLGIFNFIKKGIVAGKTKDQIFAELRASNVTGEQFEAAYMQAQDETSGK